MAGRHTGKEVLSRRYAAALFALAQEKKALTAVEKDMAGLAAIWKTSISLQIATCNPVLPRIAISGAFAEILKKIKAHTLTKRFIDVLGENRRLALLPTIITTFQEMLKTQRGEVTAIITSVAKLSDKHVKKLTQELGKATGNKILIEQKQDPEILGGLQIRIGSRLLDDSLAGKLERLRLAQKSVNA